MAVPRRQLSFRDVALRLLGGLMCCHLAFIGFNTRQPEAFQKAAETYVAILLALMVPAVRES
jgi:hypothetical protein